MSYDIKKIVKNRKILCGFWIDQVKKVGKFEKISGGSIGILANQFLKNQGSGGGVKCCYYCIMPANHFAMYRFDRYS